MALRCGTTANGCNGKVGMYRIDFVVPDAAYVRYRYEGEAWREVKDPFRNLNYKIEKASQPGQGQGVRYRISAWTRANLFYGSLGGDRFDGTFFPHWGLPWQFDQFTGPITRVRFFRATEQGGGANHIRIEITDAVRKISYAIVKYFTGPDASGRETGGGSLSHYWTPAPPPPNYEPLGIRFVRVDGQPETDKWRLSVIDSSNNNVVFSREETTQPEAVVIPEAYGNNKGNFNISNRDPNKFLRVIRAVENDRKVTNVFLDDVLVQKLTSPIGATLYPKVCWDCDEGDKCPQGTCEVKCSDHICCVDRYGRAVQTIKK